MSNTESAATDTQLPIDFDGNTAPESTPEPEGDLFRIPASRFAYLEQRIAKLCRRRHKLLKSGPLADAAPISIEKIATDIVPPVCVWCERPREEHREDKRCWNHGSERFVPGAERVYFICRVTGPAVCLEGYEFIATLQHEKVGTILRTVPSAKIAEGELDRFRQVKPHCEHCQVRRYRKDSFVVRNIETRETVQVGRNCLGKYIGGGASPKSIAALAELLIQVRSVGFEEESYGWGGGEDVAFLPQFLTFVAASIRLDGWTSRGAAREDDSRVATVDLVWDVLFPPRGDKRAQKAASAFRDEMTDGDQQTAINALMMAGNKLLTDERLSDYEHNLRVSLGCEYVDRKRAGIVASVVSWYERNVSREAERRARAEATRRTQSTSEHVGTVGERIDFGMVALVRVHDVDNDYGTVHGHIFRDSNGNILTWWTSSKRLDVGKTYMLRGTVKRHDEYQHINQTVLSRCSVKETNDGR